jgi:pectate lyase
LTGVGLFINRESNIIVRNMKISHVLAKNGDAITVQASTNIWIDHCELSSDMDHDKDYYDGLCDITHSSDFVTVSHTLFHDHWKASLVGHSDRNGAEDTGRLHVTYANNHWKDVNSRAPSIRFGTGHVYNSFFENVGSGINARMGAEVLVQSCVFEHSRNEVGSESSPEAGYAVVEDVDFGGGSNRAPLGSLSALGIGYKYGLLGSANVKGGVVGEAGQTLLFDGLP